MLSLNEYILIKCLLYVQNSKDIVFNKTNMIPALMELTLGEGMSDDNAKDR